MATLWHIHPSSLPPPKGQNRSIKRGPLIDLPLLQQEIWQKTLGEDDVWVATARCLRDLESACWAYADVLRMLTCLAPQDYRKSEWCDVQGGRTQACDVYVLPYDSERASRSPRGLEVYLKFSVDDAGQLMLILVSCHGSR